MKREKKKRRNSINLPNKNNYKKVNKKLKTLESNLMKQKKLKVR